jgi:hypothetical protein
MIHLKHELEVSVKIKNKKERQKEVGFDSEHMPSIFRVTS